MPGQPRVSGESCWSGVFVPTRGLTRDSTVPDGVVYPIEPPHNDADAKVLFAPRTNEPDSRWQVICVILR